MDNKKIGLFIKMLREEKELTQEQLAEALHIHRTLLTKIETGKASLTSENLIEICHYFDISSDELLLGRKTSKKSNNKINDVTIKMYEDHLKEKSKTKKLLISIILIIFLFAIYFFLTFYYSFKIYRLNAFSSYINLLDGTLIKNNDLVYLNLKFDIKENSNVEKVELYYESNNTKFYLNNNNNTYQMLDYKDNPHIFNNISFDKIKDNLYLEVTLNNGKIKDIKISSVEEYDNSNLIYNLIDKLKNAFNTKEEYKKTDLYYDYLKINNKNTEIDLEDKTYNISFDKNLLKIEYQEDNQKKKWEYFISEEGRSNGYSKYYILQKEYLDFYIDDQEIYSYNLSTNECLNGKCDKTQNDITKVQKIIVTILESEM